MMKKLTLSLDALKVESFAALPDFEERGTVAGHAVSELGTCTLCGPTCVGCNTNFGPNCPTQKRTGPCGGC
jgi:hypothetical protein